MITDKVLEKTLQETFGFLQDCYARHYNEFLKIAFLAHLKKGQPICSQGTACEHLALILKAQRASINWAKQDVRSPFTELAQAKAAYSRPHVSSVASPSLPGSGSNL